MNLFREIIVDNFAGGGGVSFGIEKVTGRHVDIAINHDAEAIKMHTVNHPTTDHYEESVWDIDVKVVVGGRPVALAWFSPDCKHFSKAKGSTPVDKSIRGLAWVAVRWAAIAKPRVITLENVEEFVTWGRVIDGKPSLKHKGETFRSFVKALESHGYKVEHKVLRACDYGAPTIRKRFILTARRDKKPIAWPKPTHGAPDSKAVMSGKLKPWRTAAECIDWSIPCPSIFDRKRPLVINTCKRIVKGFERYVLNEDNPFVVNIGHSESTTPFVTEHANASSQRNMPINEPLRTLCAQVKGGHFAVVAPFIAKHYTGVVGSSVKEPLSTVTTIDHNAVVYANILKLRRCQYGQSVNEPAPTLTAGGNHLGVVNAWVLKYYGTNIGHAANEPVHTITTKERFAVLTVKSIKPPYSDDLLYQAWWCARFIEEHSTRTEPSIWRIPKPRQSWINVQGGILYDIGMRMFQPRELYRAQGFDDDYIIDRDADGNKITKTSQVARCGNAVPPPLAAAIVKANLPEMCDGGILYDEQSDRRRMTA